MLCNTKVHVYPTSFCIPLHLVEETTVAWPSQARASWCQEEIPGNELNLSFNFYIVGLA